MACRAAPLVAHHLCFATVSVAGPWALPGRRRGFDLVGVDPEVWSALASAWIAALGPLDEAVVIARRQEQRPGLLVLLLQAGRPVAFVKTRVDAAPVERERAVVSSVPVDFPFRVCAPLAWGFDGGQHWLASTPLPARPHRPVRSLALGAAVDAIASAVSKGLDRPPAVPEHWTPLHGDFAPWNLRRSAGQSWLLDWEDAGWGPPHADAVYWAASVAAVWGRRRDPWQTDDAEAVAWWVETVNRRLVADPDSWLDGRLLAVLEPGGATAATRPGATRGRRRG